MTGNINFSHRPVLLAETIENLVHDPDGVYVDGTAGGGGHSAAILERLSEKGRLVCVDQDPDAIATVTKRFENDERVKIVRSNFEHIREAAAEAGFERCDGVLMDIGVSSHQLDCAERGFSYHNDAPLDMRMSQSGTSAADLVATLSWQKIAEILTKYGEEKFSVKIAKKICEQREKTPILTTLQLADIIRDAVPAAARRDGHPARRTFQALRIAVNDELGVLERGMESAFDLLRENGRLAIITFHSLEDRIVKRRMAQWCSGCTCPPDFPVCVCGNTPHAELVTRKPIAPSEQELEENPRSRSSKLRVCKKMKDRVLT